MSLLISHHFPSSVVQSYSPAGLHSGHCLPFSSQRNKTSTIAFAGTGQGSPGVWRVQVWPWASKVEGSGVGGCGDVTD